MVVNTLKKTTFIIGDVLLLSFLLVIFIVPFLVSLNLDPQVRTNQAKQQILGISESDLLFDIKENISSSKSISPIESNQSEDTYKIDFTIISSSEKVRTIEIGSIRNPQNSIITLNPRIAMDTQAMRNSKIYLYLDGKEMTIFDGQQYVYHTFKLEPNEERGMILRITSPYKLQFDTDIQFEIEAL